MDEEITIIDSNARNERIRNFFINNKKKHNFEKNDFFPIFSEKVF